MKRTHLPAIPRDYLAVRSELARSIRTADSSLQTASASRESILPTVRDTMGRISRDGHSATLSFLITHYLKENSRRLREMKPLLVNQANRTLARLAHNLGSESANLGAIKLRDMAHLLEVQALTETRPIPETIISRLETEFSRVRHLLLAQQKLIAPGKPAKNPKPSSRILTKNKNKKDFVLYVEDLTSDQLLVRKTLEDHCQLASAHTAAEGLRLAKEQRFDLILLDIMLPDSDGYTLCTKLRQFLTTRNVPIIFVTVKTEMKDKLKGFSLGADDYITKPFDPAELKARVKSVLDRQKRFKSLGEILEAGPIVIEFPTQKAYFFSGAHPEELDLTPIEFKLLVYFVRNEGRVLTRKELLNGVWGPQVNVLDRTIDKHVSYLRKKIGGRKASSYGFKVGILFHPLA